MNVSCPECRSVFRIDPVKVPARGVRARCNVCGGVIAVEHALAHDAVVTSPAVSAPVVQHETRSHALEPREHVAEAVRGVLDGAVAAPAPSVLVASAAVPDVMPLPALAPTAPAPTAPAPPAPTAPAESRPRPVNPYLNNTPELRARRLARALVSDLVAYNPQKREQGLRDGTLRQLFRDEIRKSWDEYVEQVGANVAESTPHFQDALNDVLAGGRRVF